MAVEFTSTPVSIDCHPSQSLFVLGHLDGTINLCSYDFSSDTNNMSIVWSKKHKRSIRRVRFTTDGRNIFSNTQNRALCQWDTVTGSKLRCLRTAHNDPPYALCMAKNQYKSPQIASGDENGVVKTWDFRKKTPMVSEFSSQEEDITDLSFHPSSNVLLSTSSDATLAAYNLSSNKIIVRSEPMHSELLSIAFAQHGQTFCGAADSYIEVFKSGEWGNLFERIPTGHSESVDCLLPLQQNLLVSGSSEDGCIRLIQINPNRSLAPFASHPEGVEEFAVSSDGDWLLSCGHDNHVRVWDLNNPMQQVTMERNNKRNKRKLDTGENSGFFDDLIK